MNHPEARKLEFGNIGVYVNVDLSNNELQPWWDHASLWSTNLLPRRTSPPARTRARTHAVVRKELLLSECTSPFLTLKVAPSDASTHLCKTSRVAPQWRLCPSTCASASMRKWKRKRVFHFNAGRVLLIATSTQRNRNLSPTMKNQPPGWSEGCSTFCSQARLEAAAVQSKHWAPFTHIPVCVCSAPPEQRRANERRWMSRGGRGQSVVCAPQCVCVWGGSFIRK